MGKRWRMLRRHILPSSGALIVLWAVLGLLIIGLSCGVVQALTAGEDDNPTAGLVMLSCTILPLLVAMLVVSSLREKRPAPRAVMWFVAAGLTILGGSIMAIVLVRDPEMGLGGSSVFFFAFCAPVALLFFLPGIYFAIKAAPELKTALREERGERALRMIRAQGRVSFAALAEELGMDVGQIADLLEATRSEGDFDGFVDAQYRTVYSRQFLEQHRRHLLGALHARGQLQVDALADELNVPLDLLKGWLYELVEDGRFTGFINWQDGMLYSREAQKLREQGRCPNCGGELTLAGKGVFHCAYCGAEVFL